MNLAAWLVRAGRAHPARPAVARGTGLFADYGTLAGRAARLAGGLAGRFGLAPGDRVAIVAANCPEYVEMLFGAWHGGFAAVPVNAKLHGAEIADILGRCGARVAFATSGLDATIAAHGAQAEVVTVGGRDYEALLTAEPVPLVARAPGDLAWLFYTSGTTGKPKGAMLSHRNLAAMTFGFLTDVDPTGPNDSFVHGAPMSHGSGLYSMALVCRAGLNVIPESGGFEPEEILRLLAARPGGSMFAAPTMIKRLVACPYEIDPAVIRTLVWGGAPMHVADVLRALERFGPRFAQIYGQGETPMTTTVLSREDIADHDHPRWMERLGSAGIANSAVEVRVADENDATLPPGETGEVLVRGDSVMAGYWNDPQATAKTLRGGWLHTGDVGAFDADGYLTLKDRSKDVIISGGANVYPREVEEVLLRHPEVREVSVIGRPDEDWGEVVVAYVVAEGQDGALAGELDRLCLESIARFKRPKDYVFVEALPKNNYGKILKTELRARDRARCTEGVG